MANLPDLPHDSAHLHVTGAARFIDDHPPLPQELTLGLVLSPHAKASITSINTAQALAMPGVRQVFLASHFHHNVWGSIHKDQPLLASSHVNHVGEVIAVVAGTSKKIVQDAIACINVDYKLEKPILSIADAVAQQSFIGDVKKLSRGNAQKALSQAPHRLSGMLTLQGAEHFYLENQACLAYPADGDRLHIHSSTQHPTEVQMMVAEALGLPYSAVICTATRLGGGFGGKETQAAPFAVYAALAAHTLQCPARLVLSKDEDMLITGKRNPYEIHYTVGFDDDGMIVALDCTLYGNAGAYTDLSPSILERAMAHVDNAYYLPNVSIKGYLCRTNYHSHTAFRGFGGPKGVALIEHILEEIGHYLSIDSFHIRRRNCYQHDRITTPYGQRVDNNLLPELFDTLRQRCDYDKRRLTLNAYNENNKNPRGMSLTAIKFGISFTTRFLNQGHALIHLFRDGSLQVATGGVEMGQGVHGRIKGIIAHTLGVSPVRIHVLDTSTDKSANTSPTAASSGTDLNGTAALHACLTLKQRLSNLFLRLSKLPQEQWPHNSAHLGSAPEPDGASDDNTSLVCFAHDRVYLKNAPKISVSLADLINNAYLARIPLSAYGFYKVPDLSFNKLTGQGRAFHYFTQGVACAEVEIDQWTGQAKVLRADILMDGGAPINRAMDLGQITGGFVQGLGWILMENLFYDSQGKLLNQGPSTYKIPSIHDMPRIFNVDLMVNDGNGVNLFGTKALGEPPLMLCFCIWNALKDALRYKMPKKRLETLPIPATNEVLLRALKPDLFRYM